MTKPTRYPGGLNNAPLQSVFEDMGQLDPSKFHNYFNDFDLFTASDWTITTVEAGAGSATEAIQNEDGGVLLITNDDADDDSDFLQLVNETFKFETGKALFFKTRLKVSDAIQSDFIIGLQITDTTPLAVTDGIYFRKDDGDALLDFVVIKDSIATTATGIATIADDTYLDIGFFYNGVDKVSFFVNNQRLGFSVVTNLPDDEELTISFGIQNGEAAAKTMSIDYIQVAKGR